MGIGMVVMPVTSLVITPMAMAVGIAVIMLVFGGGLMIVDRVGPDALDVMVMAFLS